MSGVKLNVTRREALKIDLTIEKAAGGHPEGNHERIWSILEYCCCWKYSVRKVIKKLNLTGEVVRIKPSAKLRLTRLTMERVT